MGAIMKKKVNMLDFTAVLVAVLVVMTLFQANADRLPWSQLLLPLGISILVALFYMGIFALNPFTQKVMPVMASVFTLVTLMFFVVTPIGSLIVLVLTVALCLIFPRYASAANIVIGIVASIGVLTSLILSMASTPVIQVHSEPQYIAITAADDVDKTGVFTITAVKPKPNIYFIVPDRMPSPAAMRESGIEPAPVIVGLQKQGFYVKDDQLSRDPYLPGMGTKEIVTTRTMRFFASILNGGEDVPMNADYKTVRSMINVPSIFSQLHQYGYTVTNIGSWFQETKQIAGADTNLKYQNASFMERIFQDELAVAFWNRTVLSGFNFRRLESQDYQGNLERGRITWQVDTLKQYATSGLHNQFIMAHILMPHEPFVYQADGSAAVAGVPVAEAYLNQIKYSLALIYKLASDIHREDPTAIIIIQSDEGMGYRKPAALNFTLTPVQWNGVFTAWYVPDT